MADRSAPISVFADAGPTRGNTGRGYNGPVRYGAILYAAGIEVSHHVNRGNGTINQAEIWAVELGVREALDWTSGAIRIFSDSDHAVRCFQGKTIAKDEKSRRAVLWVRDRLSVRPGSTVMKISRGENRAADALVKG